MNELSKKQLRKVLLAERKSWLDQQPGDVHGELSKNVAKFLIEGKFTTVLGFWPFGAEPDFRPLYRTLMKDPRITFGLPTIDASASSGLPVMHFIATDDEDQLAAKPPFGILEPRFDLGKVVNADAKTLVLVPALGIDGSGFRLGYGGGYYDRFLAAHPEAIKLGTVFSPFYPRWLPTSDHDISVGYVTTESAVFSIPPQ